MEKQLMISVSKVSKKYNLGVINSFTLAEEVQSFFSKILKKEKNNSLVDSKFKNTSFNALDEVSFNVYKGEAIGIIGGNGAGKSTLLKIISKITSPSSGHVVTNGRITSMLEVGTGFNPELTGRENIYLNGAILGMKNDEIESKLQEIIDFSECQKFIDTPVKRYSSGMFVKLAYSVAAHLNNEIMIMDEVLAVGDVNFQKKCVDKMIESIEDDSKTILFVSHNMEAIRRLCNRCIVLKGGRIIFEGNTEEAISVYLGENQEEFLEKDFTESNDLVSYGVNIKKVKILERNNVDFSAGDNFTLEVDWGTNFFSGKLTLAYTIYNGLKPVKTSFSDIFLVEENCEFKSKILIDTKGLPMGRYTVRLSFFDSNTALNCFYVQSDLFIFRINNIDGNNLVWRNENWGDILGDKMEIIL